MPEAAASFDAAIFKEEGAAHPIRRAIRIDRARSLALTKDAKLIIATVRVRGARLVTKTELLSPIVLGGRVHSALCGAAIIGTDSAGLSANSWTIAIIACITGHTIRYLAAASIGRYRARNDAVREDSRWRARRSEKVTGRARAARAVGGVGLLGGQWVAMRVTPAYKATVWADGVVACPFGRTIRIGRTVRIAAADFLRAVVNGGRKASARSGAAIVRTDYAIRSAELAERTAPISGDTLFGACAGPPRGHRSRGDAIGEVVSNANIRKNVASLTWSACDVHAIGLLGG